MSSAHVGRFQCAKCGRTFAPADGGKCRACGRLLCLSHFSVRTRVSRALDLFRHAAGRRAPAPDGPVCRDCARAAARQPS